jgi:hypothetical protein
MSNKQTSISEEKGIDVNTRLNYSDTPEGYMKLPANDRFPIDAINCAKARARAVINILIAEFGGEDRTLSDETVANVIWGIEGYLNQMEIMINHSYQAMHPHIYEKQPAA